MAIPDVLWRIEEAEGAQRMSIYTLRDVIQDRALITARAWETVSVAARRMAEAYKGAILIVDGEQLKGIFTERDLLIRVVAEGRDPATTRLTEVMTTRLILGHPDQSTRTAIDMMVTANCRHLPVVERGRLLGIVSRRQLMAVDLVEYERQEDRTDPSPLFI